MSAAALVWAWQTSFSTSAKIVLLACADQAAEQGDLQVPQTQIAEMTGLSERAVRQNLARLEEAGALRRYPQTQFGQRVADVIVLAVGGVTDLPAYRAGGVRLPAYRAGGKPMVVGSPPADPATGTICRSLHPLTDSKGVDGRRARHELPVDLDAPVALLADAQELLAGRVKVGSRVVDVAEMTRAVVALAEFNRHAGYDYGLSAHLTRVVSRVRERPSFEREHFVRLVASAWRVRWWERRGNGRRPTPAVIFGNADVFDAVVQDAIDERAGREPTTAARRFVRRDGKGRAES